MTRDFHQRAFFASYYLGGLASGTYVCKQYKVTWHVNFPSTYTQTPFVWVREREINGWWGDGSTSGVIQDPWAKVTNVTTTGFDVETYVYWIESTLLGQQIKKYWPGNSNSIQAAIAYTAIGIPQPLSAAITGPSEVFHPEKNFPANCYTWNANVTGGQQPYTYVWLKDGNQVGTNSSYSECFGYNGASGGSYQFALRVEVRDAQNTLVSHTKTVTAYNSGGGGARIAGSGITSMSMIPEEFGIAQNFPNPFNPETQISFALPEASAVRLSVTDVLGREIAVLEDRILPAGYRTVQWNGLDANGSPVGSGLYFYRIEAVGESGAAFTRTLRMVMAK
jgi:hypothetical protein